MKREPHLFDVDNQTLAEKNFFSEKQLILRLPAGIESSSILSDHAQMFNISVDPHAEFTQSMGLFRADTGCFGQG